LRGLLIVWLILVAMGSALIGSAVRPGDRILEGIFATISVIVPLFQIILLFVIVPMLVQEEPLVGTTAFWFTRPLRRSAILGAKALFVAMLVLLPLLTEVAVFLAHGVTLHDVGLAIPEIVLGQIVFIATLALLAALTPSFGRFAIAGAILLVGSILITLGIYWIRIALHPESMMNETAEFTLQKSRSLAEDLLVAIGGGALIVHQYLTRKTTRSAVGAGIVTACAIAILGFWPWDFFRAAPLPDLGAKPEFAGVTISVGYTFANEISSIRGVGEPQESINGNIDALNLPEGYVIKQDVVHPRLALPDGRPVPTQDPPRAFGNSYDLSAS
jgi:hypothetical protein